MYKIDKQSPVLREGGLYAVYYIGNNKPIYLSRDEAKHWPLKTRIVACPIVDETETYIQYGAA